MAAAKPPESEADDETLEGEGRGAHAFWSGTLSFGLVTIPVDLYAAQRTVRASLRMLSPDGTPLVRRYYVEGEDQPLGQDELARGYELDDGSFVLITDEELEGLAPDEARDIDLTRFVAEDELPPLYFERAYFLVPSTGSTLSYRLLTATMERTHKAGIATFVMRGKQYVVAIRSERGIMRAETLRFADEIRSPEVVGLPAPLPAEASDVKHLRSVIKRLTKDSFPRARLSDPYWDRLSELVAKKQARDENIVEAPQSAKRSPRPQ